MKFTKKRAAKPQDRRDVYVFLTIVLVAILAILGLFYFNVIHELGLLLGLLLVLGYLYFSLPPFIIEVKEYEEAIVFRMGKYIGSLGPGLHFLAPAIDEAVIVDKRVRTIDVPKQKVVTRDEIELTIDAIIYYKVVDPKKAVIDVRDYKEAAVSATYAHIRDIIGKMSLSEVLSNIDKINKLVSQGLKKMTDEWGVSVDKVEIKEVYLPDEVIGAMHKKKAAEELKKAAEQEALANAIKIDAVREAAGKLNEPALQFLYLEALKKVAEGKSSKILFPVELSKMAERIAGVTGKDYRSIERDLRREFKSFVKEEEKKLEFGSSGKHVKEFLKKSSAGGSRNSGRSLKSRKGKGSSRKSKGASE